MRFLSLPLLLVLALLLGCGTGYRSDRVGAETASAWPYYRADMSASGAVVDGSFNGQLGIIWEAGSNDKPSAPLTIYDGNLVYCGTKRRIKFYDLDTGDETGSIKAKWAVQTGLTVHNSRAFYGTAPYKDRLYAIDITRGSGLWTAPVKDAVTGSIIIEDRLITGSRRGVVFALGIEDGSEYWSFDADGRLPTGPSATNGEIFQPTDDGTIHVLDPESGQETRRLRSPGPISTALTLSDAVYVADVTGYVHAVNPATGEILWSQAVGGSVWGALAYLEGRLFAGLSSGELVALDAASGRVLWRVTTVEVVKAPPVAVGNFVVVGTMAGGVIAVDVETGEMSDRARLEGAISIGPVTDGERIFVATEKGRIVCLGKQNQHATSPDN